MATVTKPIALDESLNTTELSSRNVADVLAQELSAVATAIGGISAPSAEDVSYDNSGSGLSATDVQNALDEIVSDIPTVNDGTLTIQQNGETKGTFTANQSGNSTVNMRWMSLRHTMAVYYQSAKSPLNPYKIYTDMRIRGWGEQGRTCLIRQR